jgi:hypothetical protein
MVGFGPRCSCKSYTLGRILKYFLQFSIKHPSIGLTMIQSLKRGLNKELFGYREGRRNTEKHGKRFVTSAGVNLTWCTSA